MRASRWRGSSPRWRTGKSCGPLELVARQSAAFRADRRRKRCGTLAALLGSWPRTEDFVKRIALLAAALPAWIIVLADCGGTNDVVLAVADDGGADTTTADGGADTTTADGGGDGGDARTGDSSNGDAGVADSSGGVATPARRMRVRMRARVSGTSTSSWTTGRFNTGSSSAQESSTRTSMRRPSDTSTRPTGGLHGLKIVGCKTAALNSEGVALYADNAAGVGTYVVGTPKYSDGNGVVLGRSSDPFNVVVTAFGAEGQPIEGTFTVTSTKNNVSHTLIGSFHVCRAATYVGP